MLGLKTVVLECKDIPQLLDFYSQLLKWPVVYKEETFVRIQSGDTGMCIGFQYAEDYIPPVWTSKAGKQQMMCHLDFGVTDKNELEAATKKAVQLGAKIADEQFGEDEWITLIDPAGHPFCFVLWD